MQECEDQQGPVFTNLLLGGFVRGYDKCLAA